jgi:hypothetical protein
MPDDSLLPYPTGHLHTSRLVHPNDVDGTFVAWMREAYAVDD